MYIGIDVGGTNLRIGAFSKQNQLTFSSAFHVDQDFNSSMDKIVQEVKKLSKGKKIDGIGIGIPGPGIDLENGMITTSTHLKGWLNQPIKKTLETKIKTKVIFAHDVVSAAIGEATAGEGKNLDRFTFLAWGTGLAAATVEKSGNRIKVAQLETAHQIVVLDGRKCNCGQKGCLEAYIGGWAVPQIYKMPWQDIKSEAVWNEIAKRAAQGIINLTVNNPNDIIFLGGGVFSKQPHLKGRIEKSLKKQQKVFKIPTLKLSKLGNKAAMYGASNLFFIKQA